MLKRIFAGGLTVASAVSGAFMLIDGAAWHAALSSLAHIGPYRAHAVADAGAAFLAAGAGLIVRAWRPRYWLVAIAGLGFVLLHGIVHLSGVTGGHTHDAIANAGLLAIPAALALWTALPDRSAVARAS